jgi:hypothetical protein
VIAASGGGRAGEQGSQRDAHHRHPSHEQEVRRRAVALLPGGGSWRGAGAGGTIPPALTPCSRSRAISTPRTPYPTALTSGLAAVISALLVTATAVLTVPLPPPAPAPVAVAAPAGAAPRRAALPQRVARVRAAPPPAVAPAPVVAPTPTPTPTVAPAPPPAAVQLAPVPLVAARTHRVQRGDTLWAVARRYDLSLRELRALNPDIPRPDSLVVGTLVRLPNPLDAEFERRWVLLALCESGGNAGAMSRVGPGLYRGAFQFDLPTWQSVGMTGDPIEYPYGVQLAAAKRLYARRGAQPWPVCGRVFDGLPGALPPPAPAPAASPAGSPPGSPSPSP